MAGLPLAGKVALVTGSSSGMGRATALALARHGSKVVCCDLKAEPNPRGYESDLDKTTVQVIENNGGEAIFQQVDISNFAQAEAAFDVAVARFGRLDILVNCAGYWAPFRTFAEEDDELWAKMLAINAGGTSKMCRLALRQFLKQDVDPVWGSRGRIVNISSCAANIAYAGEAAYAASKAAINHMTRAGAIDHAKDAININCIAPGVVETGMARGNLEDQAIVSIMKKATPWPRLGKADDIAGAVLYFCLPSSQWVTGQVIAVDGGMTLGVPAG
ncbi:Short chain dehydrogenase/reductase family oxidoreductase [Pleurostoma richardsiae]|uniref:Short chain dehydrogenase/reductase family oxidoreductase n=1 Tax=Pleurostoma richardsiae TaxID=41990 RepID=A0AA38R3U6_9PEZI|nr:Short chain dehydrogenase/reductase family oxidoreductase [Pleurostoma richardsiae]